MSVPIACSLTPEDAGTRVEEWRRILSAAVIETVRPSPDRVEFHLVDDLSQMADLIGLAQREKQCCPFLEFNLSIDAEAVMLVVTAPEEASSILDGFTGLAA